MRDRDVVRRSWARRFTVCWSHQCHGGQPCALLPGSDRFWAAEHQDRDPHRDQYASRHTDSDDATPLDRQTHDDQAHDDQAHHHAADHHPADHQPACDQPLAAGPHHDATRAEFGAGVHDPRRLLAAIVAAGP
ncbi:MAG TPA: hypothetical protein VLR88_07250 [Propionibacteriaceae bacterium]|nr:hypothetical protein [Propionibacteriaceae bacterium]